MHRPSRAAAFAGVFVALAAGFAVACSGAVRPDNAHALDDIQNGRSGDEVIVEGIVTHVGHASRGGSGEHEHFDIRISSGAAEQDILVADNITVGVQAPVKRGDDVTVKGVLEVDPSGPVIHWTHHDPENRHEAGFVMLGGRIYE